MFQYRSFVCAYRILTDPKPSVGSLMSLAPSSPQLETRPSLVVRDVDKSFGATRALKKASLEVRRGEVHALVGENGAGKSTLIKILAGAQPPDSGEIIWEDRPYDIHRPDEARRLGIATCHQELAIAPHLTVVENILLGDEFTRAGWIDRARSDEKVRALLESLHQAHVPLHRPTGELPLAAQQFVEIARAIASDARLVILDEPTSALTRNDTRSLFELIRRLRDQGISFLYVSHFLEEIMELCDRYTVMRDGETVATGDVADTSIDDLISKMVGRRVEELYPQVHRETGATIFTVDGVTGEENKPQQATFELKAGEILGFGGLVGSGRSELLRSLYGLRRTPVGRILIHAGDSPLDLTRRTPAQRLAAGLGFASEDRKSEGLALIRSLADNIALSMLARVSRLGWISEARLQALATDAARSLATVYRDIAQPAGDLSGGNQQKIALARLLFSQVRVLLLDEPTRGIDVGSKAIIYKWLGHEAAQGKAVVLTSSYSPELLGICDRIGVMYRGRIAAIGPRHEWTEEKLLLAATTGSNPL